MSVWVEKWEVDGSNGKTWVVAKDTDGNYGCSCPVWKFKREECKHIRKVLAGVIAPMPDVRDEELKYAFRIQAAEEKVKKARITLSGEELKKLSERMLSGNGKSLGMAKDSIKKEVKCPGTFGNDFGKFNGCGFSSCEKYSRCQSLYYDLQKEKKKTTPKVPKELQIVSEYLGALQDRGLITDQFDLGDIDPTQIMDLLNRAVGNAGKKLTPQPKQEEKPKPRRKFDFSK